MTIGSTGYSTYTTTSGMYQPSYGNTTTFGGNTNSGNYSNIIDASEKKSSSGGTVVKLLGAAAAIAGAIVLKKNNKSIFKSIKSLFGKEAGEAAGKMNLPEKLKALFKGDKSGAISEALEAAGNQKGKNSWAKTLFNKTKEVAPETPIKTETPAVAPEKTAKEIAQQRIADEKKAEELAEKSQQYYSSISDSTTGKSASESADVFRQAETPVKVETPVKAETPVKVETPETPVKAETPKTPVKAKTPEENLANANYQLQDLAGKKADYEQLLTQYKEGSPEYTDIQNDLSKIDELSKKYTQQKKDLETSVTVREFHNQKSDADFGLDTPQAQAAIKAEKARIAAEKAKQTAATNPFQSTNVYDKDTTDFISQFDS